MNTLRNIGKLLTVSALAGVLASAILLGVQSVGAFTYGTVPNPSGGFALQDSTWLRELARGNNRFYTNGLVAHAGGTQAAALVLSATGGQLFQVDTVASSGDSVALPECAAGTQIFLRNAGAQTLNVYGNPTTNTITAALDTINGTAGTSAYTMATNTNALFFCAKDGAWSAMKGS